MTSPLHQATTEVERKFVIDDVTESKLNDLGATLGKQVTFTDTYYDTADQQLTLSDFWLRNREGQWQLKCPPAFIKVSDNLSTQYAEITVEKDIVQAISGKFNDDLSSSNVFNSSISDVPNLLKHLNCIPFAKYTTTRKEFKLNDFIIDLDITDFGFKVGEIELSASSADEAAEAVRRIDDLAKKLGIQERDRIPGKMDKYLILNKPDWYKKLVEGNIIHRTGEPQSYV